MISEIVRKKFIMSTKSTFIIAVFLIFPALVCSCSRETPSNTGLETGKKVLSREEIETNLKKELLFAKIGFDQDAEGRITGIELFSESEAEEVIFRRNSLLKDAFRGCKLKKVRISAPYISIETLECLKTQTELEELHLQDSSIGGVELAEIIGRLPYLKRLTLRRLVNVLDEGIESLETLKDLKNLALIELRISGKSVDTIVKLKTLNSLDLRNCQELTFEDIAKLPELAQLQELKLAGLAVSDSALKIVSKFQKLKSVTLEEGGITNEGFVEFLKTGDVAARLQVLAISRMPSINDAGLSELKNCPNLKSLILRAIPITGDFLHDLANSTSGTPPLEVLFLDRSFFATGNFDVMQKFSKLKRLNLFDIYVDKEQLEKLAKMPALERLELPECRIDDEMLEALLEYKKLRSIDLRGNPKITEEGIKTLKKIPSLKEIDID